MNEENFFTYIFLDSVFKNACRKAMTDVLSKIDEDFLEQKQMEEARRVTDEMFGITKEN